MAAAAPPRRPSRPASQRALLLAPVALWALLQLSASNAGGTPSGAFSAVLRERPGAQRGFTGTSRRSCSSRPGRRCAAEAPASDAAATEAPAPTGKLVGTAASIAKGMVGSGILSLSAGVAAFTQAEQGLLLALVMLAAMTVLAGYTFRLVAEVSAKTGAKDFGGAWTASMGEGVGWVPRVAVMIISVVSCIVYSMILGDSLATIFRGVIAGTGGGAVVGWKAALLPWCTRTPILLGLTLSVLLPLCLAESFANLAFTSLLGLAACLYLAGFTLLRSLDGSYAVGGRFLAGLPVMPAALVPARKMCEIVNMQTMVLLSTFGMAYMNHGMAPGTYQELAVDRKEGESDEVVQQRKMRKYDKVILLSFGFAGLICAICMSSGFNTFGAASAGNLLASYSAADPLATVARLCVMVSILFGFPLNFVLLRTEVASALSKPSGSKPLTYTLLAFITGCALVLHDLGKVQAVAGATVGSFVVFVAPALMARAVRRKMGGGGRLKAAAETMLVGIGIGLGVFGLGVSLSA